jgi:hypothetical protein
VLDRLADVSVRQTVRQKVLQLCRDFPVYDSGGVKR